MSLRMKRIGACLMAALVMALAACGQRHEEESLQMVAHDPSSIAFALHLILTIPEGMDAPKELLEMPTLQQGAGTSLKVPWVRSVKREAPSGFGHLSTLGFADAASLEAWRSVHATQLVAPLTLKRARVLTQSRTAATGSPASVFKISYYSLVAPVSKFEEWVNGYLTKYLEAQLRAGILASYVMYLEEQGRALLVLEYPDAGTEQSAEPLKEKLSEQLAATDATYARLMQLKEEVRTTQSWTLAIPAALDQE